MNIIRLVSIIFLFSILSAAPIFSDTNIKSPNVAGQFYPKEADKLTQMVDGFISEAKASVIDGQIYGIIAPHAGYVYSGGVAAYAYKAIRGKGYDTVVVIAPSHSMRFNGVSIWPEGTFVTPIGEIQVDSITAKQLMELNPEIKNLPKAYASEHSLEVQLPFLQRAIDDFKVVPLITGDLSFSSCGILAHSLKIALEGKNALVVASTDLSHYHSYEAANKIDELTVSLIKMQDAEGLYEGTSLRQAELCGLLPVTTLLLYMEELGNTKSTLLKYANSGDVTGDYSGVVGYASFAFHHYDAKKGESEMFSKEQKEKLLKIARDSISNYFKGKKDTKVTVDDAQLNEEMGAFVTLKMDGQLRGCIGRMMADKPLAQTVSDMAVEAAFSDPRFPPLTEEEFKKVSIEISALSPMRKVDSAEDIELGKHGVMVRKGFRSGVFLPQVATETGWSKEEFLSNLCAHKAGLSPDAWKDGSVEIYIFSAEVFGEE